MFIAAIGAYISSPSVHVGILSVGLVLVGAMLAAWAGRQQMGTRWVRAAVMILGVAMVFGVLGWVAAPPVEAATRAARKVVVAALTDARDRVVPRLPLVRKRLHPGKQKPTPVPSSKPVPSANRSASPAPARTTSPGPTVPVGPTPSPSDLPATAGPTGSGQPSPSPSATTPQIPQTPAPTGSEAPASTQVSAFRLLACAGDPASPDPEGLRLNALGSDPYPSPREVTVTVAPEAGASAEAEVVVKVGVGDGWDTRTVRAAADTTSWVVKVPGGVPFALEVAIARAGLRVVAAEPGDVSVMTCSDGKVAQDLGRYTVTITSSAAGS